MSMTFKAGDAAIHRIIEMECGITPARGFSAEPDAGVLDANRSWMHPAALDAEDRLVRTSDLMWSRRGKRRTSPGR